MLGEWTGATVESGGGKPTPDVWNPVDVPGKPPALSGADVVAYKTEFDDPRDPDEARAVLELRGLYAHARVWLNDELVGHHNTYFRPFHHAFEPVEHNELVVECRRPEDRFGGIHDTDAVSESERTPGIWWGARVETYPEPFIYDLSAHPRVTDDGAAIDVRAVVEAGAAIDDRITFSLRPEGEFQSRGMMDRASVESAAGERATVEHTIDVRDPSLWWPRGLGPQHRYNVRAKLDDISRSVTTGLCDVDRDDDGLLVNGERVPGRGFNLVSATTADVERAVEANATLVRMHAHAPPASVYEAADEAGLLVWQDVPLTGPGEFGIQRGRDVVAALARTYDNHPSLAAFAVHDDPVDLFPEPLGTGMVDRSRLRWRTWRASHDASDARTIASELPDDRPVFPVVGPVGIGADAPAIYPGWDYGAAADTEWVMDHFGVGDVVAEFGAAALGMADPDDETGFDAAKHDHHVDGDDGDDGDDVDASQHYQTTVVKRVAETLRRRGTSIYAAFALRDAGDAGMGVLARDGSPKTAYDALQASYEPVQAMVVDPSPGATSDVGVVNDTADPVAGTLSWSVGGADGETDFAVDPHDDVPVETIAIPGDGETLTLTLSLEDRTVTNTYHL